MGNALIVFASITTANKIKYLLAKEYAMPSRVVQAPRSISNGGCSYCLKVARSDLDTAWKLCKDMKVMTKGAYDERTLLKIM